jgi:hypothetical protein
MTGIQWVELTLANAVDCYDMFRMSRSVFLHLHDTLVQNYGLKSSRKMCMKEAVAMFLWMCGGPRSFRQARNRFKHSLETISRKVDEVLDAIMGLAFHNIRPQDPQFGTIQPKLQEARFWPHFKDCIGAIDGTHIEVTVPASEQPKYIGRHGYTSQNVMAVCDFDMRFTFVVTGWPGSVHDTRVFLDTLFTYQNQFPKPPNGKYYLVDSGYPNRKGYLAPYRGQRYHVSEWQHHQPVGKKEMFNHAHSSLRNVIERSFGVLKMKWRILLHLPSYPITKQAKIIVACIALHNFVRENTNEDPDFNSDVQDNATGGSQLTMIDASAPGDDIDMGAFRDAIADSMMS